MLSRLDLRSPLTGELKAYNHSVRSALGIFNTKTGVETTAWYFYCTKVMQSGSSKPWIGPMCEPN